MPPIITPTEREVGRLAGVLERVVETVDETRDDVKALQVSLRENTVLTSQLTTRLMKVENQLNDYTTVRYTIRGGVWVLGALFSVIGVLVAGILKVFNYLPGTFDAILTFFHLK